MKTTAQEEIPDCSTELHLPWLNTGMLLRMITPHINRVFGTRQWSAFSMSNGYVYVQPSLMWDAIKAMAKSVGEPSPFAIGKKHDQMAKRLMIFFALQMIQADYPDAVAKDWIQDGYYAAFFTVSYDDRHRSLGCYLIPFNVSAFNVLIEDLERRKPSVLRAVKKVEHDPHWKDWEN